MKIVRHVLLAAVMVFPLFVGCSANKKVSSEILEERMRKPGGPLAVPDYSPPKSTQEEPKKER